MTYLECLKSVILADFRIFSMLQASKTSTSLKFLDLKHTSENLREKYLIKRMVIKYHLMFIFSISLNQVILEMLCIVVSNTSITTRWKKEKKTNNNFKKNLLLPRSASTLNQFYWLLMSFRQLQGLHLNFSNYTFFKKLGICLLLF